MPNKIKNSKRSSKATIDDVLEAVNSGFTDMEQRFQKLEKKVDVIDNRLDKVETRLTNVESQMVTKEYLDDKLADLRGDLVIMVRKEDTKLKKLVDILEQRQLISIDERQSIFALEPFALV